MYVFIYFSILLNLLSQRTSFPQNIRSKMFKLECAIELGRREPLNATKTKDNKIPKVK